MPESPQSKSRPKKSKSRRSSRSLVRDTALETESTSSLVAPKPRSIANDTASRVTNETTIDITQEDCELDNDTTALMARLEKKYSKTARRNKPPAAVAPPAVILTKENGEKARLSRWEENRETEEEATTDDDGDDEVETHTEDRFAALHKQMSQRSLHTDLSKRSLQQDTLSQAPSIISEQYLESVEDLPFDDDSFVPLMVISPIQVNRTASVHTGTESQTPFSSTRRMQGIREANDSQEESESSYPPPVSEIDINMEETTDASHVAGYQSEKLSQFLKASGQDDEVAYATAQAFEAFLLSQEQAMLQLIPEDDIRQAEDDDDDDDTSLSDDFHHDARINAERPRQQTTSNDAAVYAKLAAIQMGMNQAHIHQSSRARDFNRGRRLETAASSRRHSSRRPGQGCHGGKENRYRGMQRHGENDRYFYESRSSQMGNESFAADHPNQVSPYEDQHQQQQQQQQRNEHVSTRSSQMARLARHESKKSIQSQRRNLVQDSDTFGRVRRNDPIGPTGEPSREQKLDQYNDFRQSGRTTQGSSISSNFYPSQRNMGPSSSMMPHVYHLPEELGKPPSVGSNGSSTWSSQTLPPASERSERTLAEQIETLPIAHRACYNALKSKWELKSGGKKAFPDELYLRFAMCSRPPFDFKSAWQVMKRFDRRYLNLSVTSMEKQLLSKTIFPVAGLKSRGGHDMLYIRPSRFVPGKDSTDTMIDNLVYAMGTMLEKEQACIDGIGVIANMTDWKMANFSVKYWHKLMMTLQGKRVPARVVMLLIVNPPSWFGSIWTIMRPMLSEPLRSNVLRIPFHEMDRYLANGFERFLPDEMHTGYNKTSLIVRDFIVERKRVEKMQKPYV